VLNGQEQAFLERMALAEQLGLPVDARLGRVVILEGDGPERTLVVAFDPDPPGKVRQRFPDCPPHRIELLGVVVEMLPAERQRPHISPGTGLHLEVWLAKCPLENALATAVISWPPTGGSSIIALQFGRWRTEDLETIGTAAKWLETIPRHGGTAAASDAEAFDHAVGLGLEWLRDHPGEVPAGFSVKELAAKRFTKYASTQQWMKHKHVGIRAVQRELARRISRPR